MPTSLATEIDALRRQQREIEERTAALWEALIEESGASHIPAAIAKVKSSLDSARKSKRTAEERIRAATAEEGRLEQRQTHLACVLLSNGVPKPLAGRTLGMTPQQIGAIYNQIARGENPDPLAEESTSPTGALPAPDSLDADEAEFDDEPDGDAGDTDLFGEPV